MNGIIERFKNHMFNTNIIQESEEELQKKIFFINYILPNYDFGDVIWAIRTDFEWERKMFKHRHLVGPFIVIDKTEDKLICMFCTSIPDKNYFFEIGKDYDLFNKRTYTSCDNIKTIDYESFVRGNNIGKKSLSLDDKSLVAKQLHIKRIIDCIDLGEKNQIYMNKDNYIILSIGDLIRDKKTKQLKVVANKDNEFIYTIPYNNNYISESKELASDNEYIMTLPNDKLKDYYINNNESPKPIEVGNILRNNFKYYYVYFIEDNIARTFSLEKDLNVERPPIIIDGLPYIPYFFKQYDIQLNDESYCVIGKADYEEMQRIIKRRKKALYKRNKKRRENMSLKLTKN